MPQQRTNLPELVAHRGNAADFPENTLPALRSALDAGIRWVEIDVQLSADGVPFVIHDASLGRTTRCTGDVRQLPAAELATVDAGEPQRFGDAFRDTLLPRLADFAELLSCYPAAGAFVELKRASLGHHGRERCLARVREALGSVLPRCVMLSFDAEAVAMARGQGAGLVGWVIDGFDDTALGLLHRLRPDFAFYDYTRVPPGYVSLPPGPWRWAAYEVKDATRAWQEIQRGAALVESMAPLQLKAALESAPGRPG